jgi:hypothetical protein
LVCAACLLLAASAHSAPAVELKILATDPAPDVLLARQQPFFVRFELKSAEPVTVTVSGLYKGKAVIDDGGTGAPALLPAGGGIGVVNFFYWGEKPTRIDEVRLKIDGRASGAKLSEYAFPVALTWLMDDPPPREPPAWVREWQEKQRTANTITRKNVAAPEPAIKPYAWLVVPAAIILLFAGIFFKRRRECTPPGDGQTPR